MLVIQVAISQNPTWSKSKDIPIRYGFFDYYYDNLNLIIIIIENKTIFFSPQRLVQLVFIYLIIPSRLKDAFLI